MKKRKKGDKLSNFIVYLPFRIPFSYYSSPPSFPSLSLDLPHSYLLLPIVSHRTHYPTHTLTTTHTHVSPYPAPLHHPTHDSLVKLPEVRETMQSMAREMMRAGMIEEMVDETMSSMEVRTWYHMYTVYQFVICY
jgi:hypothetical protein